MGRLAAIALSLALLLPLAGPAAAEEGKMPKLVTVLTSAEPQSQLMAMVLTMQAVMKGSPAHVLLCGPAGDIALEDAPESATAPQPPRAMSPQGLMKQIMEKGAVVEVCAIYLPGKNLSADALIEGVTAAKPDAMADVLLGENVRLLSL